MIKEDVLLHGGEIGLEKTVDSDDFSLNHKRRKVESNSEVLWRWNTNVIWIVRKFINDRMIVGYEDF